MGLLDKGLAKLTLEAYQGDNKEKQIGSLKVMYNPESVSLSYGAKFNHEGGVNQHHDVSWFQQVSPPDLSLDLILDARGPRGGAEIDAQLSHLRAICFTLGDKGDAPYLRITWGSMGWNGQGYFSGRVSHLAIAYTLFDRDAKPLRATASLTLQGQTSDEMAKIKSLHAPQPKSLTIADKASLPLLQAQAANAASASAYLALAYANDTDHLSGLKAGQMLITP